MNEVTSYNLDAEIAVLGSILIDPRVFPTSGKLCGWRTLLPR